MAVGGAAGSVARWLTGAHGWRSTLAVNLVGSFLLGLMMAVSLRRMWSPTSRLMMTVGFLGSYTTFSAMMVEGVRMAAGGGMGWIPYWSVTVLGGLAAAWAGLRLGGG